jgi:hypothetical protein
MVYVDQAGGGAGQAGALQVIGKTGNQVTLLNPTPPPAIPLASSSQAGLLAQLSGQSTDYVGGDNACHALVIVTARYYGTDTGTAAALVVTVASDFALATGVVVYVNPANFNAASPTLTVNGTGAKAIVTRGAIALHASEISPGRIVGVLYDGTQWRVITPIGAFYAYSGAASAQNFDCHGYDSITLNYVATSGTALGISLLNLAAAVPLSINIYNAAGAACTYTIAAYKPGGASYGGVYWQFSNLVGGTALGPSLGTAQSMASGNYMFMSGMVVGTTLFLK